MLHYDVGLFHTSIHFICAPLKSVQEGKLVLLERIKNHYYFDYFTTLACPYTVHCEAEKDMSIADLSMLKNYDQDVVLTSNDANQKTYFSVCKPIVDQAHLHCPAGSAICERTHDPNSNTFKVTSFGVPVKPPKYSESGSIEIHYQKGSPCLSDKKRLYNSTIIFQCDPSRYPGKPALVTNDKNACHRTYQWQTIVACFNTSIFDASAKCHISHPWEKIYSLQAFRSDNAHGLVVPGLSDDKDKYFVQLCGSNSKCAGSICYQKSNGKMISLGYIESTEFLDDTKTLEIRYLSNETDLGRQCWAEVHFVCDKTVRETKLEMLREYACHPIFEWRSAQACPAFDQDLVIAKNSQSIRVATSNLSWLVNIFLVAFVIGLIFHLRKPQNRERLQESCLKLKSKICCLQKRNEDTARLVEHNVTIPTFGGLHVDEDDDDLILA